MGGAASFFESVGGGIVDAAKTVANTAVDVANGAAIVAKDAANKAASAAADAGRIASTVASQTASIASTVANEAKGLSGQALDLANQAQEKARQAAELAARAAREESEALANQAKGLADEAVALANRAKDIAAAALDKARAAAEAAAKAAIEQTAGRALGMVLDGLGLTPSQCYKDADARNIITKVLDTIAYLDQIKAYKVQLQASYQDLAVRKQDALNRKAQSQQIIARLIAEKAAVTQRVIDTREGATDYNKPVGPVPALNNIGCLTPGRLDGIIKYLQPYIDQINQLTAETNALSTDIANRSAEVTQLVTDLDKLGKQQDELTSQIRSLNEELAKNVARNEKLDALKNSVDKSKCCVKDSKLATYNEANGVEFLKPITPQDYCGQYWGRGGKCDGFFKQLCVTNPTDSRCSCYSQLVLSSDSNLEAVRKTNPRCYSAECDATKYLDSAVGYGDPCDILIGCNKDLPVNASGEPDMDKFNKQYKKIQVSDCKPMYMGNMFLLLLVFVIMIAVMYSYSDEIDKELPGSDLGIKG